MPNFADFIQKILAEHDPQLDMSGGTAAQDVVVRAPEYILRAIIERMRKLEDRRDLGDPTLLEEFDLDRVGNSLFVPRNQGVKSTGVVRLYFSRPTGKVCEAGATFETATGLRFINTDSVYITAAQMALNADGEYYYMDVPSVEAEVAGQDYSIGAREIVRMVGQGQDVVKVTNPAAFSAGAERMSNTQYMSAIKYGISVRDLVTRNSIYTSLSQVFQQHPEYSVAGYNDVEMQRDRVYGLSVGGCVDIYPYVFNNLEYNKILNPASGVRYDGHPVIFIRKDITNSETGQDFTQSTISDLPISDIISVEVRDLNGYFVEINRAGYAELTKPDPPYFMRVPCDPEDSKIQGEQSIVLGSGDIFWNPRGLFSYPQLTFTVSSSGSAEDILLDIDPKPPKHCLVHSYAEESMIVLVKGDGFYTTDDEFRVTWNGVDPSIAEAMQDYVDNSLRKTINADHLIRAMIPVTVDVSANIVGSVGENMVSDINDFIENAKSYTDINLSKLFVILDENGAETVDLPVYIKYTSYLPNGTYYSASGVGFGMLDIDGVRSYYEYVGENLRFIPGDISINVVSL